MTKETPTHIESKVHLPNGKVVAISHVGNTCVLANQPISNVLFLPEFMFNLLFVSHPFLHGERVLSI